MCELSFPSLGPGTVPDSWVLSNYLWIILVAKFSVNLFGRLILKNFFVELQTKFREENLAKRYY